MFVQIAKVVAVIALLCAAAAIATPRGRIPLALRALHRVVRRDAGLAASDDGGGVPAARRLAAFALVVLAAVVAIFFR